MATEWEDFETDDYLQFVKWRSTRTIFDLYGQDSKVVYLKIVGKPVRFTNKFGKEQYKIRVVEYIPNVDETEFKKNDMDSWLAGGIRLVMTVKRILVESKYEINHIKIIRTGKGFDTEYFATAWNSDILKKTVNKKQSPNTKKTNSKKPSPKK